VVAHGCNETTGARILTVSMVCDLNMDRVNNPRITKEHFKSNFDFMDELHQSILNY